MMINRMVESISKIPPTKHTRKLLRSVHVTAANDDRDPPYLLRVHTKSCSIQIDLVFHRVIRVLHRHFSETVTK